MNLRLLTAADVKKALPMAEAIAAMKSAFAQLSGGQAVAPLRSHLDIGKAGSTLIMPAYLQADDALAVKIVSVFPANATRDLPVVNALVIVLDAGTGQPLAILEGGALTAIRTGAGAGAATDVLARKDAESVAIIGSGTQARTQLEAVCTVRQIREVRIYSPTRAHAATMAAEMAGQGAVPTAIEVSADANEAIREADIVCTATTSAEPVFDGLHLKPGAHINAIGSFKPEMQEVDARTVQGARVVVDSRAAALAEAGDLIVPLRSGAIQPQHIYAELGEIIAGLQPGREDAQQITYFKSVGVAVQDAAAARLALTNAAKYNLGTTVAL